MIVEGCIENMSIAEKSNHAIMDPGMNEEILNLEKKLSECLAEKDLATREKNGLLIEKTRLTRKMEELEEFRVKAKEILSQLEMEKEPLTEAIEAIEKDSSKLYEEFEELRIKAQHRCLKDQFERVRAEFQELSNEIHKPEELLLVRRRKQTAGRQIERSTQYHKNIMRCDLVSLIVDVTSHICETIFTSKHSKIKDMQGNIELLTKTMLRTKR
jgi:chromosome segregation ATPase